jgi:hypothetical protein
MKIKRAVKLDLGEMCKLRLLFFVDRVCINEYIYIYMQSSIHGWQKIINVIYTFHQDRV